MRSKASLVGGRACLLEGGDQLVLRVEHEHRSGTKELQELGDVADVAWTEDVAWTKPAIARVVHFASDTVA